MNTSRTQVAITDIIQSFRHADLATFLAWEDIRQRYVRTMLGPFWIVLSTGIWFTVMGFVMASLFGEKLDQYIPFMVSGLLVWGLISSSLAESTQVMVAAAPLITNFSLPIFMHYIRFACRNFLIFVHNLSILLIVMLFFPVPLTSATWLIIPGICLDLIILLAFAVTLSLTNLRYRDTNLAVASALQILPIITPVFWDRGMLKTHSWIADINPFYHMLQIVRSPMLGQAPDAISWIISLILAAGMSALAGALFLRYRHRIIFWL